eukprot:4602492-Amphidinium_carterae.1
MWASVRCLSSLRVQTGLLHSKGFALWGNCECGGFLEDQYCDLSGGPVVVLLVLGVLLCRFSFGGISGIGVNVSLGGHIKDVDGAFTALGVVFECAEAHLGKLFIRNKEGRGQAEFRLCLVQCWPSLVLGLLPFQAKYNEVPIVVLVDSAVNSLLWFGADAWAAFGDKVKEEQVHRVCRQHCRTGCADKEFLAVTVHEAFAVYICGLGPKVPTHAMICLHGCIRVRLGVAGSQLSAEWFGPPWSTGCRGVGCKFGRCRSDSLCVVAPSLPLGGKREAASANHTLCVSRQLCFLQSGAGAATRCACLTNGGHS